MSVEHKGNYSLRLALLIKEILDGSPKPMTTAELTAHMMIRRGERMSGYQRQLLRRNIIRIGRTYQALGHLRMELVPTAQNGKVYRFILPKHET